MEKAINIVAKIPTSVSIGLAISLAGGLGAAINSFREFWFYIARKK
jgi:hypothetical protein